MFIIEQKISEEINKFIKNKQHLQLTVGVLENEQVSIKVYNEFGEMNTSPIYSYEIGSITKTFTSALLAKYILEEKVSSDDSIEKYLTELPTNQYYPTFRRLATHTSGYNPVMLLRYGGYFKALLGMLIGKVQSNNPFFEFDNIDIMKKIIREKKLKDMDYNYAYCDFGMGLLGHTLGEISGKGYSYIINDFIINELGLADTLIDSSDKDLHGYDRKNNDCGNWEWRNEGFLLAAAGIRSTAIDLLQYAKLNVYDEKPYLSYCHKKHAEGTNKYDMGLGWQLQKESNVIWHSGATGSFTAFLGFDKNKRIATVILSNYRFLSISKIGLALLGTIK